jgi:hypothetical protein
MIPRSDQTPRQRQELWVRLQAAAERDLRDLLRDLRRQFPELPRDIPIRFEAEPSKAMLDAGVDADAFCAHEPGTRAIVVYLLNLHAVHGGVPGEFKRELRGILLREIGDRTGVDLVPEE